MDTDVQPDEPAELAVSEDGCIDLEQWPDALIRAVAAEAPELIRSDDPFACRERDLPSYARGLALISLEETDLDFVDLPAYTQAVREQLFQEIDVEGVPWFVVNWQGGRDEAIELPKNYESLSVEEWPDELIAAAGQQAPGLLRTDGRDTWALTEAAFPRFADYWLFEGYCDSMLYPHVDRERFIKETRAQFTEVTVAGERWYARVGDPGSDVVTSTPEESERKELKLLNWPDSLVAAVAGAWPQVFRTSDYEMICAVPDKDLQAVVASWAFGHEVKVKEAGGVAAWTERVIKEDFRPFEVAGHRWWVYIADWKQ
jgi:organic hydroperoxide reductase OsmC/OhrA